MQYARKKLYIPLFLCFVRVYPVFEANIYAYFNEKLLTYSPESGKVRTPLENSSLSNGNTRQENSV